MKQYRINHAAVWVCVLLFQALGVLWYSPALFAEPWMNYLGKTFGDFDGESIRGLCFSLMAAVSFAYFLAWLFVRLRVTNAGRGLGMASLFALICFAFPTAMQDGFSLRPQGLTLINAGSIILNFCVTGLILGAWKKEIKQQTKDQ